MKENLTPIGTIRYFIDDTNNGKVPLVITLFNPVKYREGFDDYSCTATVVLNGKEVETIEMEGLNIIMAILSCLVFVKDSVERIMRKAKSELWLPYGDKDNPKWSAISIELLFPHLNFVRHINQPPAQP